MKICIAQTKPIKGNITENIKNHIKLIHLATQNDADIIIFPELSITGYEAELAKQLATTKDDQRFDEFQKTSDTNQLMIGIGLPTTTEKGICISLVIFQPNKPSLTYSKKHLHPGEEKYFVPGKNLLPISFKNHKIAFAICYETSVTEHTHETFKNDANIYIASVLNSVSGVDKDIDRISNIAKNHKATAVMANFAGESGGYNCAGKSSIWNTKGVLIGQLNKINEGIAVVDTDTEKVTKLHI